MPSECSFPFAGQLLDAIQTANTIRSMLATCTGPIDLCSAFMRSDALENLLTGWKPVSGSRILVRWQRGDLVVGASDFRSFDIASHFGFEFYMRLNFHGKVYSMPPRGIVVGSANATLSGLGLARQSNSEVSTLVDYRAENSQLVQSLFRTATLVDSTLLQSLVNATASDSNDATPDEWPAELKWRLCSEGQIDRILVSECFLSKPRLFERTAEAMDEDTAHDMQLLGLTYLTRKQPPSLRELQAAFRKATMFQWLVDSLRSRSSGIYFGELTARLQQVLLDDPAPKRFEVKVLLQNLLCWVSSLDISEVIIDRPSYSQRIRLIEGP